VLLLPPLVVKFGSVLQGDGLEAHVKEPGVHDIDEPEFSILKQRVARRIVAEGLNVDKLDIAALTKVPIHLSS
jgi:hypothetical protein